MKQYHDLLSHILDNGADCNDRTGIGTRSVFGYQMRFNLQDGFPAVTTKKLQFKSCVAELLWFLEGSTDERRLAEIHYGKSRSELKDKTTIWTANADNQGRALGYINNDMEKQLGPVYGRQWRSAGNYGGYDQIKKVLKSLKENPESRRHIVSAWDSTAVDRMALPPCHTMFQFYVSNGKLSLQLYQRSGDAGLGIPFNIASYSLLTHIIARECNLEVGDFVHSIGDAHIYLNHIEQVKEQLSRKPYNLPTLRISNSFNLAEGLKGEFDIDTVNMFTLENYLRHPAIKMEMAV